ncbi:MAG: hypothetical protein P8X90_27265 [Desulfobacterales bacterium]|jgi:hypothetical protein
MVQSSFLRVCKSCGEDFAKSVKECPHCGKKVQSGKPLILIIGIGCLALAAAFAIPIGKDQPDDMKMISIAPVDQIDSAELAALFNDRKLQTSQQAQRKVREITDKIVQWELEVFAVTESADCYQILTKATKSAPGTLLTLFPRDSKQQNYLDNLKPGFTIRIKGKIAGFQQGRLRINPAFLL